MVQNMVQKIVQSIPLKIGSNDIIKGLAAKGYKRT